MGKNNIQFPKQNPERNHGEKFTEEEKMKNNEDIKTKNKDFNVIKQDKNKIYSFNHDHNNKNKQFHNKFNISFLEKDFAEINYNGLKELKNSTNDFNFHKNFCEDYIYLNQINNNEQNLKQNKFDYQQNPKEKVQGQFKSTAADFKIKYKTELCKYYEINGFCKYGEKCAYAHGKENLRSKVTNSSAYRTRKCTQFFECGYCPYGSRCQFAHQLTTNIINNPYDRKMSYKKTLETISKLENIENIKKLIPKPRLAIFREIFDEHIQVGNNLLNDIKNINKNGVLERIDINDL